MAKISVEDLKTTLKTEAGFSDEQLNGLTQPQLQAIANGYMRQSDYDRSMNEGKAEIQKAQTDLATANERLNAEMAEWAQVQQEGGKVTQKMRTDMEKAQQDALRLQQVVTRMATDAGLDPAKYLGDQSIQAPPQQPQAPNLDGYVTTAQLNQRDDALANLAVTLPGELFALDAEHRQLFGTGLNAVAITNEMKARSRTKGNQKSLDPRVIWEELHKIPEKRVEVEKKRWDDAMKEAEQRGREAAISESSIPGQVTAPGRHSPLFKSDRQSVVKRPQPGSTVQAAVQALRSGKYREGGKSA